MKISPATPASIAEALNILRFGGVVAHATETCYGLACDMRNQDAVKKLFLIKDRPFDQPVSALFASIDEAKKYVEWNEEAEKLAKQYLPGPLTMILPMKKDAPQQIFATAVSNELPAMSYQQKLTTNGSLLTASLGLRISSHPLAQKLVTAFGSPLSTTSANIHGLPNPYSAQDIAEQFEGLEIIPDLVLDSGILPNNPPSTVVNLSSGAKTVHRSGSVGV